MANLSESTSVPHALSVAYRRLTGSLRKGIKQYEENLRFSNSREICQDIERFGNEMCHVSAWRAELERRSGLIETRCAPGTAYDQAKARALDSYSGQPEELSGAKLAITGLRTGNRNPNSLADVVRERGHLELVLEERILGLSANAVDAFQQWLDECRNIQREAERLEVDGCRYIYHVYRPARPNSPDASKCAQALIKTECLGGVVLDLILDAADSVVAWVREHPGLDFVQRLLSAPEPPALSADELARLRAYLKVPMRPSALQNDPEERENRRKLQEILLYNEELQRAVGTASESGSETTEPPKPKGKRGGKSKGGRKPDPKIAQRNKQIVQAFQKGASVDKVCKRFGVSAGLARNIKSKAGLGRRKEDNQGES